MLTMEDVFRRTIVSKLRFSEEDDSTFSSDYLCGHDPTKLEEAGIITRSHYHDQHMCPHCYAIGKPVRARKTESGKTHYYVHCNRCGNTRIKKSSLLQWRLSWEAVVRLFMKGMGIREEWTPLIPDRLIKLGQRKNKDFFLVRKLEVGNLKGYTQILLNYPNAVLVVHDQEAPYRLASTVLTNPVISLYELLKITETDEIDFDYETAKEIIGPDPVPLVETRPEYGFKDIGDFWEITFAGKTKAFAKKRGFDYIRYLIRYPGESFAVNELKCLVDGKNPETMEEIHGDGERVDDQTLKEIRDELAEIEADILEEASHGEPGSDLILNELYEKKAKLEKCQLEAMGFRKTGRWQNARLDKLRLAVTVRIKSVLKEIKLELPEFGAHLEKSLKTGMNLSYTPNQEIDWLL